MIHPLRQNFSAQLEKLACRVLVPALLLWFSSASFLSCCAQDVSAYAYSAEAAAKGSAGGRSG